VRRRRAWPARSSLQVLNYLREATSDRLSLTVIDSPTSRTTDGIHTPALTRQLLPSGVATSVRTELHLRTTDVAKVDKSTELTR